MALIKGKFIDPSLPIQQSQDPTAGDDVARKSYVDTKSEGDAAAAQSAAELYADGVAAAAQSAAEDYADAGLALKQDSLGTGTLTQYLRGDLTWQEVITSSPVAQVKYVSKNGNDAEADGSEEKPYLTIAAAMAAITDASPTKRYGIRVAPGAYTEGAIALKANVFIIGDLKEAVRITASSVSMAADFSGSADSRSGLARVILNGACNFDWAAVTSAAGKLYFTEVSFGNAVSMNGHNNGIAQAQFDSCQLFGTLTVSGINVGVFKDNVCWSDVVLNQHPILATTLGVSGGHCHQNVTLTTTVDNFNRRCSAFLRAFNSENLIIDGPVSYADADMLSQGKWSTQKSNGGQLVPFTPQIRYDLETQMLKPISNNAHNNGDWGKQWLFNFAYVHGSAGTDLYLLSAMENYDPAGDTSGKNIIVAADAYGLQTDVNGGNIELETAAVSGTGVRGKVQVKARELDMTSAKITSLADGVADTDAVNKGQLDSAASAAQSAAEAAANAYTDSQIGNLEGNPDVASLVGALATSVSLQLADKLDLAGGTMTGSIEMSANKITGLADGVDPQDAVTKAQLDAAVQAADQAPYKESKVLDATDISNGYVDLARVAMPNTMLVSVSGTVQYEDEDYSLSTEGGVTRITFLGDLIPDGDGAALVEGDKVYFQYWAPLEV